MKQYSHLSVTENAAGDSTGGAQLTDANDRRAGCPHLHRCTLRQTAPRRICVYIVGRPVSVCLTFLFYILSVMFNFSVICIYEHKELILIFPTQYF